MATTWEDFRKTLDIPEDDQLAIDLTVEFIGKVTETMSIKQSVIVSLEKNN